MREREKISACVICYNEERKIRRCLESLSWCDEIVIMDSYSTDGTVDICKEYTNRVFQHEWLGYVGQRNIVREMAIYPWILFLDSDEEVSLALQKEILLEFSQHSTDKYSGYEFPRQVYYLGRWIKHGEWYPDVKLRLFRKECGYTKGQEPHDKVIVNGLVKRLKSPIWHYTYDDLRDHIDTMNRFSTISAQQKFNQNEISFSWSDILLRPFLRFFKAYIIRRGFLDGSRGFFIACISAFGVYLKYAKVKELIWRKSVGFAEMPEVEKDVSS